MSVQTSCHICPDQYRSSLQNLYKLDQNLFIKPFSDLCNSCHLKPAQRADESKEGLHELVESFMQYTLDYGAIIGYLLCAWAVYASLHRAPSVKPEASTLSKKTVVVKLELR